MTTVAELEAKNAVLTKALESIKVRLHFMGWPAEDYWKPNQRWIPDWREEIAILENALHGTPINSDLYNNPPSVPFNQIPETERPGIQ